jgi:hypothetical protein
MKTRWLDQRTSDSDAHVPVNQIRSILAIAEELANKQYTPWFHLAAMYGKLDWIKLSLYALSDRALDSITQNPRL